MPLTARGAKKDGHVVWLSAEGGWVLQLHHDWRDYAPAKA